MLLSIHQKLQLCVPCTLNLLYSSCFNWLQVCTHVHLHHILARGRPEQKISVDTESKHGSQHLLWAQLQLTLPGCAGWSCGCDMDPCSSSFTVINYSLWQKHNNQNIGMATATSRATVHPSHNYDHTVFMQNVLLHYLVRFRFWEVNILVLCCVWPLVDYLSCGQLC